MLSAPPEERGWTERGGDNDKLLLFPDGRFVAWQDKAHRNWATPTVNLTSFLFLTSDIREHNKQLGIDGTCGVVAYPSDTRVSGVGLSRDACFASEFGARQARDLYLSSLKFESLITSIRNENLKW